MRSRLFASGLCIALAVGLHVDWHLARPRHHRLSLAWPYHWVITAVLFGIVAWLIARLWTRDRWRIGFAIFLGAVFLAQIVEPMMEILVYEQGLGYPADPGRWEVFLLTMAAAIPCISWLFCPVRRTTRCRAGAQAQLSRTASPSSLVEEARCRTASALAD